MTIHHNGIQIDVQPIYIHSLMLNKITIISALYFLQYITA